MGVDIYDWHFGKRMSLVGVNDLVFLCGSLESLLSETWMCWLTFLV